AKRDEYTLYIPFELYKEENMLVIDKVKGYITFEEKETANDNTEMQNCLKWAYDGDNYDVAVKVTYNLAGKYDYISGKLFLPEYEKSKTDRSRIKVYGDGTLLYESAEITSGVLPQDVWCDVSGVQNLVIEYYAEGNKSWVGYGAHGALSNLTAQKNFPEAAE
ncbi:MAG: NPCBM/NEW2 domain-containing protein, partial [Clostridia bacterium]|nr:NPCBM/NEW2 domain-containing protein [Clostridia bacterium]